MIKRILTIATIVLAFSFPLRAEGIYTLQDIDKESAGVVCNLSPNSTVVINSDGGVVKWANTIGNCIKTHKHKVIIVRAFSAAPYVAMFSDEVCAAVNGEVGVHTPYTTDNLTLDMSDVRSIMWYFYSTLVQEAGIGTHEALSFVGLMVMIPSETIYSFPMEEFGIMLGSKYKGVCK
jgi:hypothetical protein